MAIVLSAVKWTALIRNTIPIAVRHFSEPPSYPSLLTDIGFTELRNRLDKEDITLIDVRSPNELEEAGAVPGAINIPLPMLGLTILLPKEDFDVRMGVVKPGADAAIATMCKSGVRARTAQLALIGAGFTNVRRYHGSFEDWKKRGGTIIKPNEEDIS
ncbi:Rhodanese-like domain [Trinorchestia longiramus]|nr:Rhodanese-like domain [Trinorchestia longiramus]